VKIILRGDSGFCGEELMKWCEDHGVDYVLALAKNDRLKAAIAREMEQAAGEFAQTGKAARVFPEFAYQTRDSWSRARRVVAKAEHLEKGANPRFVVTSLSAQAWEARRLYEDLYCARGEMENRIKEQLMLFADRTSTAWMRRNPIRLYFSSIAYLLLEALRRRGLKGTEWAQAQATTIRSKVLQRSADAGDGAEGVGRAGGRLPLPGSLGEHLGTAAAGARAGLNSRHDEGPGCRRYSQAGVCRISSRSALFSGGGGAENGAMVTSSCPQALFRLRQHPRGTAVEIRSVLEAGPKKLVRKPG
jgi:hypothetical protein